MLSAQTILLFLMASLTLNLLPGPDMLYIMARTISDNKRAGFLSSLGISTGLLVHTIAAASGLSLIIMQSAFAFLIVKILGAGYLIFLGIKMILSKSANPISEPTLNKISSIKIFKQGFLTNLFNPKVAIFFMAFLPQFVDPGRGNIFFQFLSLGLLFILSGTCVNLLVTILSAYLNKLLSTNTRFRIFQERITGLILVGIGIKIATS